MKYILQGLQYPRFNFLVVHEAWYEIGEIGLRICSFERIMNEASCNTELPMSSLFNKNILICPVSHQAIVVMSKTSEICNQSFVDDSSSFIPFCFVDNKLMVSHIYWKSL